MGFKDINFNIAMYGTDAISQPSYPVVYTGDESSVKLNFTVTDEDSLAGATAKVHLYFADSTHIEKPMEINLLVLSYTLTGTQNDHAGIVRADVFITLDGKTYTKAGYKFRIDSSLEANPNIVEYSVETVDKVVTETESWLLQAQTDFGVAQNQRAAEWVVDNDTRDDQFDAAQTDRTTVFNASESGRTAAFNTNETGRSNTFTVNENARQAAADANEGTRDGNYSAAEVIRDNQYEVAEANRDAISGIDHLQAVSDHQTADTDHSTAISDHSTSVADHGAFDASQAQRTTDFNTAQTYRSDTFAASEGGRTTTFNASEASRTTAFNTAEDGRATDETVRVTAESNRVTAETGRTTAESNRVTAESNRVTAESGRVTAESGRVTAEIGRATTFAGYNARITGMEADVNASATNLVPNGDFATTSGWVSSGSYGSLSVLNNEATHTINTVNSLAAIQTTLANRVVGNIYYIASIINPFRTHAPTYNLGGKTVTSRQVAQSGVFTLCSNTIIVDNTSGSLIMYDNALSTTDMVVGSVTKRKNIILIDLTATFGKGNEPTAEQMDGIMAKFTNSWFNGTANLFRANATLNKLMAVDARTEFEAKNIVVNGDFSIGTSGWVGLSSTNSVSANVLTNTADGTLALGAVYRSVPYSGTNLYYASAEVRADSLGCTDMRMTNRTNTIDIYKAISSPVQNQWYKLSGVITNNALSNGIRFYHNYADTSSALGKSMSVKNVIVIDLTAAFGSGKEPTLAEMDRLMARFPNSWFDGVKPIQTIETLYQEKANKVQEAWITPTLTNGATGTIQYRKNEFGRVEFKGTLTGTQGVSVFSLPVGYAPASTFRNTCAKTDGTSGVRGIYLMSAGSVYLEQPYGTYEVDMNGLSFVQKN